MLRTIWILSELENKNIRTISFELLAWASSLRKAENLTINAIVLGETEKIEELCYSGADSILHVDDPNLNHFLPEPYQKTLSFLLARERPEVFLAGATTTGRTIMPYLACRERIGLTADCTSLTLDSSTGILYQIRPAVGGNVLATIKTVKGLPQMATVRPHSMKPLKRDTSRKVTLETVNIPAGLFHSREELIEFRPFEAEMDSLQDSRVIVSGGRGLKKKENFRLIEEVSKLLKGNIGASREAVDRGWITYPHQIGLSGKTVSPELYFSVGISGAIQHLAGMQTAKRIIAINNDPDAQIFLISDFGIVADLFQALPLLIEKLKDKHKIEEKGNR